MERGGKKDLRAEHVQEYTVNGEVVDTAAQGDHLAKTADVRLYFSFFACYALCLTLIRSRSSLENVICA